ncbi:unnamed protein product [Arabis nemorensis]|uniref:Alpha-soluble NSF attachment protein n=1 Tax=Arabis nemorensis TaxID=586526 RepID=A0A565BMM5_9BRAS|nr:unnamed protein product [Arabis nemorensis]
MVDYLVKAEEFEKKAEKKLNDAAMLLEHAANSYKLAKSWDLAGKANSENKHDAAYAYAQAAKSFKKVNANEAASCLEHAVNIYCEIGMLGMAAGIYKELAEFYESDQNMEKSIAYYEKAAEFYQTEEVTTSANYCKLKITQYSAQSEQYEKAIKIYEEIAQQCLKNTLLKYGVKGYLLNAGLCHLRKAGVISITNALEKYKDLDPTFSRTRECKFLVDIAGSIDEEDVAKFTDVVKGFDSMTPLDSWKTTLLLRVKEKLKAMELDEDDLT